MQPSEEPDALGPEFSNWRDLTDAYAIQVDRLRQGKPGASEELSRLGRALERFAATLPEADAGNVGTPLSAEGRPDRDVKQQPHPGPTLNP